MVTRVEHYEPHAAKHSLLYSFDRFIADFVMSCMSPPDKYIGTVEYIAPKTMFGLIKSCRSYRDIIIAFKI